MASRIPRMFAVNWLVVGDLMLSPLEPLNVISLMKKRAFQPIEYNV